jgi:hypothetical protein
MRHTAVSNTSPRRTSLSSARAPSRGLPREAALHLPQLPAARPSTLGRISGARSASRIRGSRVRASEQRVRLCLRACGSTRRVCVSRAPELEKRLPPDRRALLGPARPRRKRPVVAGRPTVRSTFWFPRHPTSGLFGYTLQAAAQHACAPEVLRWRPAERGTLRRLVAIHARVGVSASPPTHHSSAAALFGAH